MLENQLLLRAGFQNQRELVETLDAAEQLGAVDQVDVYRQLLAACEIKKAVLNVLRRRLCVHESSTRCCLAEVYFELIQNITRYRS